MGEIANIFSNVDFNSGNDILAVVDSNQKLKEIVELNTVNLVHFKKVMTNFEKVVKILSSAYAGTKGMACSKDILLLLSRYQSLIKETCILSNSMVDSCISAINNHKKAILFILKYTDNEMIERNISYALQFIRNCSKIAAEIEVEAQHEIENINKFNENISYFRNSIFLLDSEQATANANLATSASKLQTLTTNENDLAFATETFKLVIKVLEQVPTMIEQIRQFLSVVKTQCLPLKVNISSMESIANDPKKFLEDVYKSGISWLVFSHLNCKVHEEIKKSDFLTDKVMSNFPSKADAIKFIKDESELIIKSLIE